MNLELEHLELGRVLRDLGQAGLTWGCIVQCGHISMDVRIESRNCKPRVTNQCGCSSVGLETRSVDLRPRDPALTLQCRHTLSPLPLIAPFDSHSTGSSWLHPDRQLCFAGVAFIGTRWWLRSLKTTPVSFVSLIAVTSIVAVSLSLSLYFPPPSSFHRCSGSLRKGQYHRIHQHFIDH